MGLVYNSQPPQTTASPGPSKGRVNRGPPGPTTPHQAPSSSYPDPRPSPQLGRPPSPPPQHQGHPVINNLADLDVESLRPEQKREGPDWFAIFNPRIPRVLDVDLVHTLNHDSVVCCVRFSYDGHYVATGCNRSAQIFDVGTGKQVTKLQDESVDKEGDLYIRSVCFSPDGKYLATGAEDKLIRVSRTSQVTAARTDMSVRCGTLPLERSGILSQATIKTYTPSISRVTGHISRPVAEIAQYGCGTSTVAVKFYIWSLKTV